MRKETNAKCFAKLRGRIIEKYGTIGNFADVLGVSFASVSHKLNGKSKICIEEAEKWREILDIEPCDIHVFFMQE